MTQCILENCVIDEKLAKTKKIRYMTKMTLNLIRFSVIQAKADYNICSKREQLTTTSLFSLFKPTVFEVSQSVLMIGLLCLYIHSFPSLCTCLTVHCAEACTIVENLRVVQQMVHCVTF